MTECVEAVLFDLDGTLAATMGPWDRCWAGYAAGGRIELLPGVDSLLAAVTSRAVTGVVSASPRRFVAATLDHFGLRRSLQVVVAREDQAQTKPHPQPWLHAAALLAVEPNTCVAVEDSAAGIRSAHAAGMRVLAIPSWSPASSPGEAKLAEYLAPDLGHAQRWLSDILTEPARTTTRSNRI